MGARAFSLVVLSLGLAVLTGCADGGGGSQLPRSSPSYMGSGDPAVLDTTTTTQFLYSQILMDINQVTGGGAAMAPLGVMSSSASTQVEGGDGGYYTYDGSYSISWDDTWYTAIVVQAFSFSDFADSQGIDISFYEGPNGGPAAVRLSEQGASPLAARGIYYSGLQAGRGSMYRRSIYHETSNGNPDYFPPAPVSLQVNGVPVEVELVGCPMTDQESFYSNYNAYYTSQGYSYGGEKWQKQRHQSGFISNSMNAVYHSALNVWSFDDTLSADYAVSHYYSYFYYEPPLPPDYIPMPPETRFSHYTFALLDSGRSHAQTLSTATLTSSGTYCGEGSFGYDPSTRDPYLHGCATFDISLTWDHAAQNYNFCRYASNPMACYGWPVDGLITIQAGGATASYAFTPSGGTFTFDAGDGSAVFQTPLTPLIY